MVTVIDYAIRMNGNGEEFVTLILQGDVDIVQSKNTGKFYATAFQTSIVSTFSEQVAARMVGKELPGQIVKLECEPYEYTIPESGEIISIGHTYEYVSQSDKATKPTKPTHTTIPSVFSTNGEMAMA